MGKADWMYSAKQNQAKCIVCKAPVKGPGDRCHTHRQALVQRRKRKPR